MAFPTAPTDGQTHVSSSGMVYLYNAAKLTWFVNYQPTSKDNTIASIPPTASNDATSGYVLGSLWYDAIADNMYVCTSPATGLATWKLLLYKTNTTTTSPTVTDDVSQGYTVGSNWLNTTTKVSYLCTDITLGAAVWLKAGFTPALASAQLPLLTAIPAISTAIAWTLPVVEDLTYALGVYTVATAGTYTITYNANHEATNRRMGYFVSVLINGIADLVQGATFTDRNAASLRWARIITVSKTKVLLAGDTIAVNHFTDDALSTVSGDLTIVRIS